MLTSHELETQVYVEHFDKNGNLKNVIDIPTSQPKNTGSEIECIVKHSDGTVASIQKFPVRSFLKQFIAILSTDIPAVNGTILDTGNSSRTCTAGTAYRATEASPSYGQVNYGIFVGTGGATAVSPTQYAMQTKINHGTGSGQLEYLPIAVPALITGTNEYYTFASRAFTNRSGGSITVSEVGMCIMAGGSYYHLICRDVVDYTGAAISVAVGNNQTLTVNYKFRVNEASGLTKNMAMAIRSLLIDCPNTVNPAYQDVSNTARTTLFSNQWGAWVRATGGVASVYGIIAGTGTGAMDIDAYAVSGSIITAGTGAGQLYYNTPDYIAVATTGTYSYTKFGRILTNYDASDITVNEFAWYGLGLSGTLGQQVMMGRWLTGGIAVSYLESIRPCIGLICHA